MRWAALVAGVLLLAITLIDLFTTMVMPRPARGRWRLTRLLFLALFRPYRRLVLRLRSLQTRERALAVFAPAWVFILLAMWSALLMLAYSLLLWSAPFVEGVHPPGGGGVDFLDTLYFSGSSLFTLGFGDVLATGATRIVIVLEGATGLALVALVISYLPTLYSAFNRREVHILLLDARAGAPPSGPELVRRACQEGMTEDLALFFREWERWAADLLETHLSYPALALFRSPHDNENWVTALGAVLDAASIVLSVKEHQGPVRGAAEAFHRTGTHAVEDIFQFFRLDPRAAVIDRSEFEAVVNDLRLRGFPTRGMDEAWEEFQRRRAAYGPRLDAIAVMLVAPPSQWIGDRSTLPLTAGHRTALAARARSRSDRPSRRERRKVGTGA